MGCLMSVSVRTRFDVFKRDQFTCQYCGRRSPEVVLELDHIVPYCEGGSDDLINLCTSCWECNRGKGGEPLGEVVTGEDPHDRAVLLLERERQLREYNALLCTINVRVDHDIEMLRRSWPQRLEGAELASLRGALTRCPAELIRQAMAAAVDAGKTASLAYVHACLKNWTTRPAPARS